MTVSDYAVQMYYLDVVKDEVEVIQNGEVIYKDRMEFLRYASDYDPKMKWVNEQIQKVEMYADPPVQNIPLDEDGERAWQPSYITKIYIPF